MKRFLLARKTVLCLIVLLLVLIFSGFVVPQRFLSEPEVVALWEQNHPVLIPLIRLLGLDQVYSSPLFLVLLLFFLLATFLSLADQTGKAARMTWGPGHPPHDLHELNGVTGQNLVQSIQKSGYWLKKENEVGCRLIRHPWGYWGSVLLHLGLVVVIAGSIAVVLTQQRGQLKLVVSEQYPAGKPLPQQEKNFLAEDFVLPFSIRLDAVRPTFWENDDTQDIISDLTFFMPDGAESSHAIGINRITSFAGIRLFQRQRFGNAFLVVLQNSDGSPSEILLDLPYPKKRDKPAYGDFRFEEIPYLIKAKYYADAARQSMYDVDPALTLRLMDWENIVGELTLRKGQQGSLGPYRVKLVEISRWTELIFVMIYGMPLVFSGFFLIILGAVLLFCTPPREFYVLQQKGKVYLGWRGGRFADLYRNEYEKFCGFTC